ncbi:uncharacterized protein LOC125370871 [Ricinus communis]|uniref:uncharacterized protein LOC125370871 n=1 Tax=Ricinus communis TaxID=3988 RepID=UPI00201AF6D2|nr:uncharacterized protein LOC125370871 [Ricinus communis]
MVEMELPGSIVGVSLSPIKILETANQSLLKSKEVHDSVASVPLDKVQKKSKSDKGKNWSRIGHQSCRNKSSSRMRKLNTTVLVLTLVVFLTRSEEQAVFPKRAPKRAVLGAFDNRKKKR